MEVKRREGKGHKRGKKKRDDCWDVGVGKGKRGGGGGVTVLEL